MQNDRGTGLSGGDFVINHGNAQGISFSILTYF